MPTRHARPPDTTETCTPPRAATAPASASPSLGPPVTTAVCTAFKRPLSASGANRWSIVPRNTAEMTSAAPASASSGSDAAKPGRETESRDRPSPDRDGHEDRTALTRDAAHPAGEDRTDQGARSRSCVQEADGGRPPVQPDEPDRREKGAGHPEDHGVEICDERSLKCLTALQVSEPLGHRPETEPRSATLRRHRTERRDRSEREGEGTDVHPEDGGDPDMADEQARHRRADHDPDLHEQLPQRRGAHEVIALDESDEYRRPRRLVDAAYSCSEQPRWRTAATPVDGGASRRRRDPRCTERATPG